jgi:hypothetical protein
MRIPVALLAALCLLAAPARADHPELARLAQDDQSVRAGSDGDWNDDARRRRVLELLAEGQVSSPLDRFHAALVLQHTGLYVCEGNLRSTSPENYLLAHHLARQALAGGVEDARLLVAQSIDRYLAFTEGRQRYGTNRLIDPDSGEQYLVPIDRAVSDEERAEFGVPPLATLLARYPERASSPE